MNLGHLMEADGAFEESLSIVRKSSAADYTSASLKQDLEMALMNMGDIKMARRYFKEAKIYFLEGSAILNENSVKDPSDLSKQQLRSIGFERLGESQLSLGDLAGAADAFMLDVSTARKMAASHSDDFDIQGRVGDSLDRLSELRWRQGDKIQGRCTASRKS